MSAKDYWGDTMPYLKIARHYGVPYELPLSIAGLYMHNRTLPNAVAGYIGRMNLKKHHLICEEVHSVVERYK